jgi:hypothetical protein
MRVSNYIEYLRRSEKELSKAFTLIAKHHIVEPDVHSMCNLFSTWCDKHVLRLEEQIERFGSQEEKESDRLGYSIFKMRAGSLGLLRDLHDAFLMTTEVKLSWVILLQCSKSLRDSDLEVVVANCGLQTQRQLEWIYSKIKISASQVLTVPV